MDYVKELLDRHEERDGSPLKTVRVNIPDAVTFTFNDKGDIEGRFTMKPSLSTDGESPS